MQSNDYIKFLTEQFVSYMDQPKETRKSVRQERKETRPSLSMHLFGLVPYAFGHSIKQIKRLRKSK